MKANKAAAKRAFKIGTTWEVLNHYNPSWKPGPREVVVNNSNSVGFKSDKGTSYVRFDQTGDKFFVSENGSTVEVRDENGMPALTYTKVS